MAWGASNRNETGENEVEQPKALMKDYPRSDSRRTTELACNGASAVAGAEV